MRVLTWSRGRWNGLLLLLAVVAFVAAACGDDGTDSDTADAGEEMAEETPQMDESPDEENDETSPSGPISQEEAEQIAVAAAGGGDATWSGREDERGATWEVEVTLSDGGEVDVLVAEDGRVVAQIPKLAADDAVGDSADGGEGDNDGTVSQEEAERAALDAVGEGSVSWSGREDDRGAAWEIEVTRPDGSEVDVLIAADGSVVD